MLKIPEKVNLNLVKEVEIAALFHDIGKFIQHTTSSPSKSHEELAYEYLKVINFPKGLNKENILKLIRHHHDSKVQPPGLIEVKSGDHIAAAMERDKDENKEPNKPLQSIFTVMKIEGEEQTEQQKQMHLRPLKVDVSKSETIFPTLETISKEQLVKQSKETWDEFYEKLKSIPADLSYDQWITTVEALMRIYCYNILSAGYQTVPTVSLYHHLTSSAAIARNKMYYNLATPSEQSQEDLPTMLRYLVISGDVHGIQKFIFDVHSPDEVRKETSKRLRGRSFLIQLLMHSVVSLIIDRLQLSDICILSNAAGTFRILAPNTPEILEELSALKQEINEYLLKKYDDKLRITISTLPASDADLVSYKHLQRRAVEKLAKDKTKPNAPILIDEEQQTWNKDRAVEYFSPKPAPQGFKKCPICETPTLIDDQHSICDECRANTEIGERLPKIDYIIQTPATEAKPLTKHHNSYQLLDYVYFFATSQELSMITDTINGKIVVYCLSSDQFEKMDLSKVKRNVGLSFQFFGTVLPKIDGTPISFDLLSELSIGLKRLGILKADVDNLGLAFSKGIVGKNEKFSIAHAKDISTRIDLFFSGYATSLTHSPQFRLWTKVCDSHKKYFTEFKISDPKELVLYRYNGDNNHLAEIEKCQICNNPDHYTSAIYGVFSGGDDLVFVGPWDMMVDFAYTLNNKFQEYVGNNPIFTLSAGIGLFEEKFPISVAIHETEELLEQSKGGLRDEQGYPIKNSVTIFGETVVWSRKRAKRFDKAEFGDFEDLYDTGLFLENKIKTDPKITRGLPIFLLELWKASFSQYQFFEDIQEHRIKAFHYYPQLIYYLARRFKGSEKNKAEEYFNKLKKIMPWARIPASWAYYKTKNLDKKEE